MGKSAVSFLIMSLVALSAQAQDTHPTVEVFAGYSYLNLGTDFISGQREGAHGFGINIAGNLNKRFGVVADVSTHRKEVHANRFNSFDENRYSGTQFLFGPRFYSRGQRITGFAHALIGGMKSNASFFVREDIDFALGFGGGIDISLSKGIALRPFQGDYVPIKSFAWNIKEARNGLEQFLTGDKWIHNFRLQTGLVFRWGR